MIGRFLKKSSPLKLLSHMNQNLVGSIYMYGRFCIKFPQSRMKGQPTEPPVTFCVVLIQSIVIFKKKGGYILKIITKLYVTCNDETISFCYKSLITILVVMMMMMRRRRWTVMMIWNILRMLLTI
jgi:hypothetical protein